jgi:hypothetical protein
MATRMILSFGLTSIIQLRSRAARGVQNEADQMMEGLPIRNWRRVESTVGAPAEEPAVVPHPRWPELPMPRDSHLLSDMSRHLLRLARLPKVSKPSHANDDDEKENAEEEETTKADDRRGFRVRRWSQMPKEYSAPDKDYLAKRRKGLQAANGVLNGGQVQPIPTIKVRKMDAEGNPHVYDVIAAPGVVIGGEIIHAEQAVGLPVEPALAPGTVIEGLGVVNELGLVVATSTPHRRKGVPVPRRKKKKKFGRHLRKKVIIELDQDGLPINPTDPLGGTATSEGGGQGDTPMADANEGEDDEGSGDEGEDMDEDDDEHEDGEISSSATPGPIQSGASVEATQPAVSEANVASSTPTHNLSSLRTEVKFEADVSQSGLEDPFVSAPGDAMTMVEEGNVGTDVAELPGQVDHVMADPELSATIPTASDSVLQVASTAEPIPIDAATAVAPVLTETEPEPEPAVEEVGRESGSTALAPIVETITPPKATLPAVAGVERAAAPIEFSEPNPASPEPLEDWLGVEASSGDTESEANPEEATWVSQTHVPEVVGEDVFSALEAKLNESPGEGLSGSEREVESQPREETIAKAKATAEADEWSATLFGDETEFETTEVADEANEAIQLLTQQIFESEEMVTTAEEMSEDDEQAEQADEEMEDV